MGQLQGRVLLIKLVMSPPSVAALVQVPPDGKHVLCFLGRQQKTKLTPENIDHCEPGLHQETLLAGVATSAGKLLKVSQP